MNIDQSLISEFLAESGEHLATIEDDFLRLEQQQDNPEAELIDKVFRAIHTLKSSAGSLGFKKMSLLAHSMETILSKVRERSLKPSSSVVDPLLEGVDILHTMLLEVNQSDGVETTHIMKRLGEVLVSGANPPSAPSEGHQKKSPETTSTSGSQEASLKPQSSDEEQKEYYGFIQTAIQTLDKVSEIRTSLRTFQQGLSQTPAGGDPLPSLFSEAVNSLDLLTGPAEFLKLNNLKTLAISLSELLRKILKRELLFDRAAAGAVNEGLKAVLAITDDVNRGAKVSSDLAHERFRLLVSPGTSPSPVISLPGELSGKKSDQPSAGKPVPQRLARDEALLNDFVVEAREHLGVLEGCFLSLEKQEGDPENQIISKIFRALHSIKGAAGVVGLTKIRDLAHAMESVIALVKDGTLKMSDERMDALLTGIDLIATMVDDIRNSEEVNIERTFSLLKGILDRNLSDGPPVIMNTNQVSTTPAKEPTGKEEPPGEKMQATIAHSEAPRKESEKSFSRNKGKFDGGETVRISVDLLDKMMILAGELVLVRNQQLFSIDRSDTAAWATVKRLDMVTTELQGTIMSTRMQPIGNVFGKFPRLVRDLQKKLQKHIELTMDGSEVELDKTILESLADPLQHLMRNCCDHGIETPEERKKSGKSPIGKIFMKAFHEGGQIVVLLRDDGKGINPEEIKASALAKGLKTVAELDLMTEREILNLILLPGFSTATSVSEISGRGVGMDVVKSNIENLGGVLEFESVVGAGSTFILRLPLTLAIIPCLIVKSGEYRYAIPQFNLVELVCLFNEDALTKIENAGPCEVFRLRHTLLPLVRLSEILSHSHPLNEKERSVITEKYRKERESRLIEFLHKKSQATDESFYSSHSLVFVVVKVGNTRFGLIVDKVLETEEIVVRPMHPAVKSCTCFSGATIMGDGKVSLILDVEGILRYAGIPLSGKSDGRDAFRSKEKENTETQNLLLFKVGKQETLAVAIQLLKRVEKIHMSKIEIIGSQEFITIDGVSTFILRADRLLNISPCVEKEEMFLFLPKYIHRPLGILISSLSDIVEASVSLSVDQHNHEGLLGSAILNNQLALFIDIYRLVELALPDCFSDRRERNPPQGGKRILVAEDTSFFRQLIKTYLENDGYQVTLGNNGNEALRLLENHDFDLIVSDIEMPEIDGWKFMQTVRQIPKWTRIPSIALTSLDSEKDRIKARECGFDFFEVKVNRESFLNNVAMLLKNGRQIE